MTKEITAWKSDDGKLHESEKDCIVHEYAVNLRRVLGADDEDNITYDDVKRILNKLLIHKSILRALFIFAYPAIMSKQEKEGD